MAPSIETASPESTFACSGEFTGDLVDPDARPAGTIDAQCFCLLRASRRKSRRPGGSPPRRRGPRGEEQGERVGPGRVAERTLRVARGAAVSFGRSQICRKWTASEDEAFISLCNTPSPALMYCRLPGG